MDKKKARKFLEELHALEEKHGISVSAYYEEEIDYDYNDESSYVSGIRPFLLLVDTEGQGLSVEEIESDYSTCLYCERAIEGDAEFCNSICEHKYQKYIKKKTHKES